MEIKLKRNSVCAADDINVPHDKIIKFSDSKLLSELLEYLNKKYIPKVMDKIDWIIMNNSIKENNIIGIIKQENYYDKSIKTIELNIKDDKIINIFKDKNNIEIYCMYKNNN
jgi:hypothetical protein